MCDVILWLWKKCFKCVVTFLCAPKHYHFIVYLERYLNVLRGVKIKIDKFGAHKKVKSTSNKSCMVIFIKCRWSIFKILQQFQQKHFGITKRMINIFFQRERIFLKNFVHEKMTIFWKCDVIFNITKFLMLC